MSNVILYTTEDGITKISRYLEGMFGDGEVDSQGVVKNSLTTAKTAKTESRKTPRKKGGQP